MQGIISLPTTPCDKCASVPIPWSCQIFLFKVKIHRLYAICKQKKSKSSQKHVPAKVTPVFDQTIVKWEKPLVRVVFCKIIRPPDNSVYLMITCVCSLFLNQNIYVVGDSKDRSYEHPKHMFKLIGKKIKTTSLSKSSFWWPSLRSRPRLLYLVVLSCVRKDFPWSTLGPYRVDSRFCREGANSPLCSQKGANLQIKWVMVFF